MAVSQPMMVVSWATPSRGLPKALFEPDGLLPFDTSSAVCNGQLIAPSGLRCAPVRSPCARGVDDELRWGPISMRVCTTCFAPSGPREVTGTLPSFSAGIASYSRALCPRRARWPASHTFGALGEPQLLRTPIPRCSGPREPSVAAARRGRFERPRRALAPRLSPPPELRGACGRAACGPRLIARRRLSSVTAEPRVPPRIRRWPSGCGPVKRGGRVERLDGRGRVAGRRGRRRGGAQAADRAWRQRQLAQS